MSVFWQSDTEEELNSQLNEAGLRCNCSHCTSPAVTYSCYIAFSQYKVMLCHEICGSQIGAFGSSRPECVTRSKSCKSSLINLYKA